MLEALYWTMVICGWIGGTLAFIGFIAYMTEADRRVSARIGAAVCAILLPIFVFMAATGYALGDIGGL